MVQLPNKPIYVISGPSGAGKTSLLKAVVEQCPHLKISISHTTRPPKKGEQHEVDYYFVSLQEFKKMQEEREFLESAEVFGHAYGTSRQAVRDLQAAGKTVVLEIDWQGADSVRKKIEVCSIFILPPSRASLLERLEQRGRESHAEIQYRVEQAVHEMEHAPEFNFVLVNDNFAQTCAQLKDILCGTPKQYKPPSQEWVQRLVQSQ